MTVIETTRGPVECTDSGDGPAVLLLHGAMGGFDQSAVLGRAALGDAAFRRIAISRPGYLGTPLAAGPTPEEQADLCAALLDALGVGQARVMAVSGGGQTALQFALRHHELCSALVMISACSAPLLEPVPLRYHLMKWMARFPSFTARMAQKAARDPEAAARRSIPDDEQRARTLRHPEAGRLLAELQQSTLHRTRERLPGTDNDIRQSHHPFDYPVERITAPVLIVHGSADPIVPYPQAEALAARLDRGELLTLRGGGHSSLFTHLDEIRARVAGFLKLALY
jgi:pimeloyl-ACP methyl ester carboxylesterase